jgi:hypothetical protein
LECKRQTLYEEEKPSKEFLEWAKLPDEKRSDKPPPQVMLEIELEIDERSYL